MYYCISSLSQAETKSWYECFQNALNTNEVKLPVLKLRTFCYLAIQCLQILRRNVLLTQPFFCVFVFFLSVYFLKLQI